MAVRPNLAISLGLIAHLEARGPGSPISADAETDFPDRGLAEHGDPVDPGTRWTLAAPRDDPLHRGRWALQHRFHTPVGAVANPPGDSGFEGRGPARLAEPHSLDAPDDDDALTHGRGGRVGHTWQAEQRKVERPETRSRTTT